MNYRAGQRLQQSVGCSVSCDVYLKDLGDDGIWEQRKGEQLRSWLPSVEGYYGRHKLPHTFESYHLPFQAAAGEARSLNSSGIIHAWAEPASEREPIALPNCPPAASSNVYHLCRNREAPTTAEGWHFMIKSCPKATRGTWHKQSIRTPWPLPQGSHRAHQTSLQWILKCPFCNLGGYCCSVVVFLNGNSIRRKTIARQTPEDTWTGSNVIVIGEARYIRHCELKDAFLLSNTKCILGVRCWGPGWIRWSLCPGLIILTVTPQ